MGSMRKTALVAGVVCLITFVSSTPAVVLPQLVLANPDLITSAGSTIQVLVGAFFDLVKLLASIGIAVALALVVIRPHDGLAPGFVTTRALEAATIVPRGTRKGQSSSPSTLERPERWTL
jgi:hypothetical protein